MLLYLASNLKSGLIDAAAGNAGIAVKKLIGKFSLRSYVTKDMRNYAGAKYFVVDYSCAEEKPDDFILALRSFQMMFPARIIIILSGCENIGSYVDRLVSIGVVNIITADTQEAVTDELTECLSDEGMQRYKPQMNYGYESEPIVAVPSTISRQEEIIKYKWNANNVKIAVHGSQRRSGVTVTAFNFAAWLSARGANVAYIEMNTNRHLDLILRLYDAEKVAEHYTVGSIDCYLTNEPDRGYDFIIYDCGELKTPVSVFREAHARLLCGSVLPYEAPIFGKAISACGDLTVSKIGLCVPQELTEVCTALFGEDMLIADASFNLFSNNVNGHIYRPLVQEYIVGEMKL